jgi:pimeloyl-ACP methyl ester carboxylesterase
MQEDSLCIKVGEKDQLHIKRWFENEGGEPVLLIHGSIENGRIFYSENGKGFAPFLAKQGYDVYVPDLRGRGKSIPAIDGNSDFGNSEMINEDIPKIAEMIQQKTGTKTLWLGAHSWGGNLLMGWHARYPKQADVQGLIMFGTRRAISIWNWERFYKLNLGWGIFGGWRVKTDGFLDAKRYKFGADNETAKTYHETTTWLYDGSKMKDPYDDYDYLAAMMQVNFPPVLAITGSGDKTLGNPIDCKFTAKQTRSDKLLFKIIGKKTGHKNDYDHINLLTHKEAASDQFIFVLDWMRNLKA